MKLLKEWLGLSKGLTILPPLCIWEQGKRPNNEDYIYPLVNKATSENRLFLVLDGIGGAPKGEVASRIACEQLVSFFEEHSNLTITESTVSKSIKIIEASFDDYIDQFPEAAEMGTTFTLLRLVNNQAVIMHLGDSRVYHIRDGIILFKTKDHTLANALVAEGVITTEQAISHRGRNVVDALHGSSISQVAPSLHTIESDIKRGDYFLLCTDGILGGVSEEYLLELLNNQFMSNEEKIAVIKEECTKHSKDNYSAYLIEIA